MTLSKERNEEDGGVNGLSNNEEFEFEGPLGRIKAKGNGALILSCSVGALIFGGGIYYITKNKDVLVYGMKLAVDGIKLLKA